VLVFFSQVKVFDGASDDPINELAPAVLALAVMSTAMVSLGIGTGFERFYGVLKRLGATPLGRPRWVAAKLAMVGTIELMQFAVLIPLALALGWDPAGGWIPALAGAALGTAAFAGLGLFLAGVLPGLVNLAVCNGLYLVLLITGGMVIPLDDLPTAMSDGAKALPAAALGDVLIGSLAQGHRVHGASWIVLGAWAVVLTAATMATFRWE
jgi:ABC-2 type transport system permease protein